MEFWADKISSLTAFDVPRFVTDYGDVLPNLLSKYDERFMEMSEEYSQSAHFKKFELNESVVKAAMRRFLNLDWIHLSTIDLIWCQNSFQLFSIEEVVQKCSGDRDVCVVYDAIMFIMELYLRVGGVGNLAWKVQ